MHEHSFGKAVKMSVFVHALQACQPVTAPGTISKSALQICDTGSGEKLQDVELPLCYSLYDITA